MRKAFLMGSLAALLVLCQAFRAAAAGIGLVTGIRGEATAKRGPLPQPLKLKFKDDVFWQDLLNTGAASRLRLLILQRSVITMREQSQLHLREEAITPTQPKKKSVLNLLSGSIRAVVEKDALRDMDFEIYNSRAVAAVRGSDLVAVIGASLNDVLQALGLPPVPADGVAFVTGPDSSASVMDSILGPTTLFEFTLWMAFGNRFLQIPISQTMFEVLKNATAPAGPQHPGHSQGAFLPGLDRIGAEGHKAILRHEGLPEISGILTRPLPCLSPTCRIPNSERIPERRRLRPKVD